jgi:YaiO family outer membrane protein
MMLPVLFALAAQASDTGQAWRASAGYGFEAFTSQRAAWQAYQLRLERRIKSGSVALEMGDASRFSLWDQTAALDTYHGLWRRAYGNLRLALAPGSRVLPRSDVTAELYQGFAGGWEASAGYRLMSFPGQHVNIWDGSLARYAGPWYLRARLTAVPQSGKLGGGLAVEARRYLRTADDYLDVSAGVGNEVVTVPLPTPPLIASSRFLAARYQGFFSIHVGAGVGATYNAQQGIPDRRGVAIGIIYRW